MRCERLRCTPSHALQSEPLVVVEDRLPWEFRPDMLEHGIDYIRYSSDESMSRT